MAKALAAMLLLWFAIGSVLMFQHPGAAANTPPQPSNRDDWVEPHAWTRRSTAKKSAIVDDKAAAAMSATCPPCPTSSTTRASAEHIYIDFAYRKLVNFLINENRMKLDRDTGQLHRTLHIHLTSAQYERIRDADATLRDIDGVLQDVWQQSRQGTIELMREVLWSWSDAWRHFWHADVLANRWLVTAVQFAGAAAVYVIARRHNVSVAVLLGAALAFAVYRHLDAECHRRLDNERIADLMTRGGAATEEVNPCDGADGASASWTSYLFGGDRREECIRYLETRYEKQCDIKALYDGFMQTFVFGSMESFFVAIVGITTSIRGTYGYIGMLLVTVLIYANLGVIISSIFRYVIGPLIARGTAREPAQQATTAVQQPLQPMAPVTDQLSGLNIERLLSITESNSKLVTAMAETFRTQCTISGVEAIEAESIRTAAGVASLAPKLAIEPAELQPSSVASTSSSMSISGVELVGSDSSATQQQQLQPSTSSTCSSEVGDTASEDDIVILEHFQADSPDSSDVTKT